MHELEAAVERRDERIRECNATIRECEAALESRDRTIAVLRSRLDATERRAACLEQAHEAVTRLMVRGMPAKYETPVTPTPPDDPLHETAASRFRLTPMPGMSGARRRRG